jgi:CyaY protein
MDPKLFLKLAEDCLELVADWLEDFDPDELDFSTTDGVVTLEFAGGLRFVLNRQAAADQMWYAAGARAWHYNWDAENESWVNDRDGHKLLDNLGLTISEQLGRQVKLG